jgi:hypothetical protein
VQVLWILWIVSLKEKINLATSRDTKAVSVACEERVGFEGEIRFIDWVPQLGCVLSQVEVAGDALPQEIIVGNWRGGSSALCSSSGCENKKRNFCQICQRAARELTES